MLKHTALSSGKNKCLKVYIFLSFRVNHRSRDHKCSELVFVCLFSEQFFFFNSIAAKQSMVLSICRK